MKKTNAKRSEIHAHNCVLCMCDKKETNYTCRMCSDEAKMENENERRKSEKHKLRNVSFGKDK